MIDDIVYLKNEFQRIKNMGWIESKRQGTTGIGYTFETLLGREENSFPVPDYGSIEIKTRFRNSKEDMSLFNATPDGDYLYPMKRMYESYAFPDKNDPRYKVFYANISTTPKYAGKEYRFKLYVDRANKKIKLIAIDRVGKIVYTENSWSFEFLKEKLERKLKYLAVIKADAKCNIEKQYFYYYQINFYMLRRFDTFLSLIENGVIKVNFMLGYYKTGIKKGQMNNHGSAFVIAEDDLEKLFFKVC